MALLLFGFESIRPSPSFLPRGSTPSSRPPLRPAPLLLHFGAFSFPPRRGGVDHSGREGGAGRAALCRSACLWLAGDAPAGAGPGSGYRARGAEAKGSRPAPLLPHPLSSHGLPGSPAPHLGLPERPRPVPARPLALPAGALRPFTPGGWASPASAAAAAVAEEARQDFVAAAAAGPAAAATRSLCRGAAAQAPRASHPAALRAA